MPGCCAPCAALRLQLPTSAEQAAESLSAGRGAVPTWLGPPKSVPPCTAAALLLNLQVLCRSGRAISLTRDHKPASVPEERQRIKAQGGWGWEGLQCCLVSSSTRLQGSNLAWKAQHVNCGSLLYALCCAVCRAGAGGRVQGPDLVLNNEEDYMIGMARRVSPAGCCSPLLSHCLSPRRPAAAPVPLRHLPGVMLAGGRIAVGDDRVLSNPEGQRQSRLNMSRCQWPLPAALFLSPSLSHPTAWGAALALAVPGSPPATHSSVLPNTATEHSLACAAGLGVTPTSRSLAAWWRRSPMCRGWSSSQGQMPCCCWAGKRAELWAGSVLGGMANTACCGYGGCCSMAGLPACGASDICCRFPLTCPALLPALAAATGCLT